MRLVMLPIAGLLLVASTAQARPVQVQLLDRTLSFNLPDGLAEVTNRNNGTNVLIEYVPRSETTGNWTRMVTIQAYRGLGGSPASSADIARQAFYPAACRIGPIYRDGGERILPGGMKRSVIANGCGSLPAGAYPQAMKGAGEQDFILMFRDADTIYTLNYAVRGAPFAGKRPPVPVETGEALLRQVLGEVNLTVRR